MERTDDADPPTTAFQVALLHEAGMRHRPELAFALSTIVTELARDAIRRAMPGSSEEERALEEGSRVG